MKNILLLLFLVTCSCSAEDGPPRECRVKVVIEVDSDAEARVCGVGESGSFGLVFTKNFEREFKAKPRNTEIEVFCEDIDAPVRMKIWVDGRQVKEVAVAGFQDAISFTHFLKC